MEKEVLYIEQGDDITDVILGISDSSAKIIAIVPPKDSDIFYDIKDVKLIHKTSLKTKKNLVLVTTDKTIINNAAEVKVPVTKDLKSAPAIPTKNDSDQPVITKTKPSNEPKNDDPFVAAKAAKEAKSTESTISIKDNTIEEPEKTEETESTSILRKPHIAFLNKFKKSSNDDMVIKTSQDDFLAANSNTADDDNTEDNSEDDSEQTTNEAAANDESGEDETDIASIYRNSERARKHTEKNRSTNAFVAWIGDHVRLLIASAVIIVILIIASFWLFVISPAVKITVYLRTSTSNFSEIISLVTDETKEKLDEGVFSLIKHSIENESKVEFEATGQKNNGEKATGSVVVSKNMGTAVNPISSYEIPAGTTFTHSGKTFTTNSNETLTWNGTTLEDCSNNGDGTASITGGCIVEKTITITATEPGSSYNIAAATTGWTSSKTGFNSIKSTTNFTGGTDDIKTIVTQKDINDARTKFKVNISADADMKAKLKLEIPESEELAIDASFSQYSEEPVSSVAVGEEPKSGEKPTLTIKTVALIYTINLDKLKQFITAKAKVADNNYIYNLGNPFIENFLAKDEAKTEFTGKLKTSYTVGINLTEQYIIDNVKGKLVGEVKPFLTSAGANRVEIETSHSLVNSVPNDVNKISVEIITD